MDTVVDFSLFFKTKAQALDFASRLALLSQQIYATNFNLEKSLIDQFGVQKKDKFITLLRDQQISAEKASDLKKFIDSLQEMITTLPVLSLTFAIEPKEQTLQKLVEWFTLTLKKQLLFEITVDPAIIGGTKMTYNGRFMDYSIKPKVDQIIAQIVGPIGKAAIQAQQQVIAQPTDLPIITTTAPPPSAVTQPTVAHINQDNIHM